MPSGETNQPPSEAQALPVVVYSPASPLQHPIRLIGTILTDLWRCRELAWILFTRDLKAQYRQSYLGYIWLFVPVVSTTIVWMFLDSTRVIQVAETPIPYPAYVLLGSLIWGVFVEAVNMPMTAFGAGRSVFTRLKVSFEAFVLCGLGKLIFELCIKSLVLVPVFIILGIVPASTAWLFPVGMVFTMLIGTSLGLLMVPIGSLYTDVTRLVTAALGFGMYLTPVVYPPPASGWAATLIHWNPMTAVVMTTRAWLTTGHSPYIPATLLTVAVACVAFFVGLIALRAVLPRLIERMGM